jgi:hypothetical protein
MAMTHSEFATQAAYLASRCASWAGECADNLGEPRKPMRDASVTRFLTMLRETADHIEKSHNQTS